MSSVTYNPFSGELDFLGNQIITYLADSNSAKVIEGKLIFAGNNGIETAGSDNELKFSLTPDVPRKFQTDDLFVVDADQNVIALKGGNGVTTTGAPHQLNVLGVDATTTSKGVAQFDPSVFEVASGDVSIKPSTYTTLGVSSFDSGVFVVVNGSVAILPSTNSRLGVSSFDTSQFNVSNGHVTLALSQAGTNFDTDSGLAITDPATHVTFHGTNGISTSGSGNQVTWTGVNATSTNPGVASFSGDFAVNSGAVSLNTVSPVRGGTGQTSLTQGALIVGNNTSPVTNLVLQDGQIPIGIGTAGARAGYVISDQTLNVNATGGVINLSNPFPALRYGTDSVSTNISNGFGSIYTGTGVGIYTLYYSNYYTANREYRIIGSGPGLWQITLQAGQKVIFGNQTATTSVAATHKNDAIHMYALDPNTYFVIGSVGNFTLT